MNNNLTLSVTLTGDNRQLSGTLKDAQGDVREFSTTTDRESKKAETALEAPGRQAGTVSEHLRGAQREARTFGTETAQGGRQATQALTQTSNEAQTTAGHLNQLKAVAVGVGIAFTTMGVRDFVTDTYAAVSGSQQLQASLKTVTGSIQNASAAWDTLLGFAADTPFTLDQSVQGFIRMQSLGLNPTLEALRSYGNTSAAMGKDMMQMVEAVADATTGEFERLKEFGIRASKEGEQISFTFQGVTTTVANSAAAISQYLQNIGENQFAGAMADQMDTLSGKASNLEDTIYQFYLAIGDAGATEVFEGTLANASNTVQFLTNNIDTLASGAETMAVLVGGRVAVALTTATSAMVAKTVATQADVRAEAAAAVATTRRTAAEKQTALALLSTARLEAQATQGTAAHTFALQQLSVARTRAATAAGAHTAAMNTATAATARASVAARGLSGALALVGGPLGLLVGGAGLLYIFREELGLTVPQVDANTTAVNKLTNGLDDMSQAAAQLTLTSLVGQLAEVRAQAEVTAEEFLKVGQIEGNGGGFLAVDVTAQTDAVRELGETSNATQQEAANLEAAIALVEGRIGELGERNEEVTPTITEVGNASKTAAAHAKELAKSTQAQADALEDLYDRLIPGRRETVQLARDIQTLNLAIAMGTGNIAQNIQAMGLLQQQYIEAQNDTDDLAKKTVDAAFTMEGAWDEVRLNGLRRLDDGFADLWEGAIDGSLNAGKLMKKALAQTLSEMGHMAVTRPITVQFATSMGFGGTGAGGQQDGGLDLSSMSSLKNGWSALKGGVSNIAWTGAGSSYGGTGWANAATQGTGATGFMGGSTANFSGMQGLASAGAGFAGSYAGRSVFGEGRDNATLETAGALVGTYFGGPLGAAAGSFIGSALASLDKETKFSGRFGTTSTNDPSQYSRSGKDGVFEHQDDGTQFYGQSALGYTGFLDRGTERLQRAGVGEDKGWAEELAQGAVARDNLVASLARSTKEIEAMQAAVQGLESSSSNAGELIEFALNERPRAALEALEGTFGEFVRSLKGGIEQVVEQAQFAQAAHGVLSQGMARLNLQFDAASAGSFEAASNLAQLAGGVENLAAIQQGYYEATYSETERLSRSQAELRASLAGVTDQVPNTVGELRAMVEAQNLNDAASGELAVRLMELAPALKQTNDAVRDAIEQQYQESLGRAPDASGMDYWFNQVASGSATLERALSAIAVSSEAAAFAADGAAGSVDSLADALREREQLERQLLTLEGNTAELRRRDLEATDESNRALQRRIWAVQDEQERLRNLDRQQQERVRTISQEASAMARARDQLASFGVTITSYIDNLRGTDAGLASPADQLAASSQAFYEQYDKAAAGDRDAMNSITQYADRFIEAQKGWSASGSQTTATIDKVAEMMSQLPDQLSVEQFLADEFRGIVADQTSQLGVMLDLNRDGVVSAIEQSITASWSGVEALKTTLYQEMQQLGAQSLTEQQVRAVLAPHATDAEINRLIQRVDHNGDGIISQEEITGSRIAGLSTGIVSALASNFSSIDVNASGLIDYDEFSQAFSGMATDSTLEKLFNLIDTNGDGQISYLESIAASSLTLAELGLGRQPGDTDDVLGGNPSAIDNIINKNPVSDPIASKVDAAYHDVMGTAAKGFQVTSWANWLSQKDTRAGQLHQAVAWANLPLGGEEWLKERGLFAAGMPEFYAGGWTGPGGKYDEAGIVHAEEFVVRSEVVKQPGVREMLEKLNRGASAYASDFRPPVVSKPASMPKRAPFPQSPPLLDFSDVLQELRDIKRELKQAHEEKKRLMKTIAKRTGEAGQAATESALRAEQQRGQQVEELQALNRAGKTRGRTV
ncbi:EF-hand domain-containing protein [Vreelandella titanicae]|uniref:EF-hand domain-containing protein n=1 Tax=Vreelandella titanicae TaxID=664683 RepID=UPI00159436C5|nr:DUF4214 domain-containing protein [Halomonas titanicae]